MLGFVTPPDVSRSFKMSPSRFDGLVFRSDWGLARMIAAELGLYQCARNLRPGRHARRTTEGILPGGSGVVAERTRSAAEADVLACQREPAGRRGSRRQACGQGRAATGLTTRLGT